MFFPALFILFKLMTFIFETLFSLTMRHVTSAAAATPQAWAQKNGCCSLGHIWSSRCHFPLSVSAAAMPTRQQIASFAFLTAHAANTTSQQLGTALPICFQQTSSRVSVNPCTADRSKTGNGTHTASSGKLLKLTLTLPFKKWINFCPRHLIKIKTFWMFLNLIRVVCPFWKVTFHTD